MNARNRVFTLLKVGALAVLSTLLLFALAGCGGAGKASGNKGSTTLTIGVGAPLTQGTVAIGQGIKRGTELAVDKMNARDDVKELGITFKTKDGDDQGDPKTGVNAANTFASDRSVIGVVGHYNSGVTIPASKVYNDNNIVMVSPGATNPSVTAQGYKCVFRTCSTDAVQGPTGADRAVALGYKTAVVVDDSTAYGEGLAEEFAKEFAAKGGKVAWKTKTGDKDTDFNALVTKAKTFNPDIVYYAGLYNAGALLSKQMKDGGLTIPVLGGDGLYDIEYIKLAGKASEGDLTTCVGLPPEQLPAADTFTKDYKAKFPGETIGGFDAYAYDAAMAIMEAAVKDATADGAETLTTPKGRKKLIETVASIKFDGVTGPIEFDEKGDTKNKVVTLYKCIDGKWVAQTE